MRVFVSLLFLSCAASAAVPKSDTVMTPRPDCASTRVSLDGEWTVRRWPFDVPETELAAVRADDSGWERRIQPGKVFYADPEGDAHRPRGWDRVTLRHFDEEDGAVIRRRAVLPACWTGKKVFLRFDAVYPCARFYLNGQFLGEHMSGLTPVEFDVTGVAKPGEENLVAVRLLRRHKFVQLDMARHSLEFCGLNQSARFFAVPVCRIADFRLEATLDGPCTTGEVRGTVKVTNDGAAFKGRLWTKMIGREGGEDAWAFKDFALDAGASQEIKVALKLENPRLWNDEYPNLYTLKLQLMDGNEEAESVSWKTGFRRLDLSPKGCFLNGNPVKFRGVNHLTFHPAHGLHTPKDWLRKSLTLMKKANVNAIRTHYLGPDALQELCDEMGFYLIQELPVDWGTHFIHLDEWMPPARMRVEAGIRRDRHHPSVMVWSVGNENMPESEAVAEAGWRNMRELDALAHAIDPSRPTVLPPPGPAGGFVKSIVELRNGDIADVHYSFHELKSFRRTGVARNPNSWSATSNSNAFYTITADEALARGWKGVWFSSEWGLYNMMGDALHAPYGNVLADVKSDIRSGESTLDVFEDRFRREWGLMRDDPTCLGGAYFNWMSQGAADTEEGASWGFMRWGENADWGVVTSDLLPKPTWWALRAGLSPVVFPSRVLWRKGIKSVSFPLKNNFNAIDFKDCTLRVMQAPGGNWMSQMQAFEDIPLAAKPGESVTVTVPLTAHVNHMLEEGKFAFLRCWFLDPKGFRTALADIFVLNEKEYAEDVKHVRRGNDGVEAIPVGPDTSKR